jgi:hypothetical protein
LERGCQFEVGRRRGIGFEWLAVAMAIIGYVSWMQPVTAVGGLLVLVLTWLLPPSRPRDPHVSADV